MLSVFLLKLFLDFAENELETNAKAITDDTYLNDEL
jgi:hypothetical protein